MIKNGIDLRHRYPLLREVPVVFAVGDRLHGWVRECPRCKRVFLAPRVQVIECSAACKQELWRQRRAGGVVDPVRKRGGQRGPRKRKGGKHGGAKVAPAAASGATEAGVPTLVPVTTKDGPAVLALDGIEATPVRVIPVEDPAPGQMRVARTLDELQEILAAGSGMSEVAYPQGDYVPLADEPKMTDVEIEHALMHGTSEGGLADLVSDQVEKMNMVVPDGRGPAPGVELPVPGEKDLGFPDD